MTRPDGPTFDRIWSDRCSVAPIARLDAAPMIRAHYLGKWPGVCVLSLGLFHEGNPKGLVVFALPPRETAKRYGCAVWELARLWVSDEMPKNTETWFTARSIRYIRRARPDVGALVSYADPSEGHEGVIYRAGNWRADGRTDQERKTPRFDYKDAVTGKQYSRRSHVPEEATVVRVPRVSKHRFVYRLTT